jgi:hypothetical protein
MHLGTLPYQFPPFRFLCTATTLCFHLKDKHTRLGLYLHLVLILVQYCPFDANIYPNCIGFKMAKMNAINLLLN